MSSCVIDGCRETPAVHVPGYPDCVDRCRTHHNELRWLDDEPFSAAQIAGGCEHEAALSSAVPEPQR